MSQQINLDITPTGESYSIVRCSQADVGRQFTVNLYDGDSQYIIPNGATVEVAGKKSDKYIFAYSDNITIESGRKAVTVALKDQMTACVGPVMCEIRIINGSTILGTCNFILMVEGGVLDGVVSTSEIAIIAQIEAQIVIAEEAAENASASATAAAASAGSAAGSANSAAQSASDASSSAQVAQTAATNAGTYASAASASATNASNSATAAASSASAAAQSVIDAGNAAKGTATQVSFSSASIDPSTHLIDIACPGVTATSRQEIYPMPSTSAANIQNNEDLMAAELYDAGQSTDQITLYVKNIPSTTTYYSIRVYIIGGSL